MPTYFTGAIAAPVQAKDPKEAAKRMVMFLAPRGVDSLLMWSNSAEYSVVYTKDYGWAIARDGVEDYRPLFSDGGPVPNRYAPRDMSKGSRYRALNRGNVR